MVRQFIRDLQNALSQAALQNSLKLGKGQCQDYAEYKRAVGFIAGLETASEVAEKMLRGLEDAERQQDLPPMPGEGG